MSLGHPQVPVGLSMGQVTHRSEFLGAQVFADLGSTSVQAGTHHRYPPYLSPNLVLKILIRVTDIQIKSHQRSQSEQDHSEPDYLHTYKGHSSTATISFIVLVIIGIYSKNINIYHRYPNKIFIMSPIM